MAVHKSMIGVRLTDFWFGARQYFSGVMERERKSLSEEEKSVEREKNLQGLTVSSQVRNEKSACSPYRGVTKQAILGGRRK